MPKLHRCVNTCFEGIFYIKENIGVILGIALISMNQRPVRRASIYSLHRMVSDYSENSLNWFNV